MGLFEHIKQVATGIMPDIREPIFYKEFNKENENLKQLKKLLETAKETDKKEINQKIFLMEYGIQGEKNVKYELENSRIPCLIMHDLNLNYNGLSAQIDFIVLTQKFILIIECKKLSGDIEITKTGDFIRIFKSSTGQIYKKEGIYNPITQNQRHTELIRELFKNEFGFSKGGIKTTKQLIVIANPKTIIYSKDAPAETMKNIIRSDKLTEKINEYFKELKESYVFPQKQIFKIADKLIELHTPQIFDYEKKYNASAEEIIPKSETSELYNALKKWRYDKAKEENIKTYVIFLNTVLEELECKKPQTMEQLKQIKGFGDIKCEKYGNDILQIIKNNPNGKARN